MGAELSGNCWKCGQELSGGEYGRGESCPGCGTDAKACRNCAHYAPALNNECRESAAERVLDKERANFCEFFRPGRPDPAAAAPKAQNPSKSAFDSLFKKKPKT